ncbi:hypothetical protein [Citricoccus sp.]|uniref:hypothetical protein n=1 Tax=Citricoccus sp. TaxID=1978372 RepID=UPI002610475B|nr:hypothetical protein [Citricoccus sp.]HRO28866.1 hypothetical protein [Citricoccus sp.]HRO92290.1 hypothetical protein [Citricoccus sp.]
MRAPDGEAASAHRAPDAPGAPGADSARPGTTVRLGVLIRADVSAPAQEGTLAAELEDGLAAAYPGLSWQVQVERGHLGDSEDEDSLDLLESTRDRMLDRDWDLAVGVCQEPLRQGRHSLTAQVSPAHSAGVVSLDLAGVGVADAVRDVVARILGLDPDEGGPSPQQLRSAVDAARQLATDVEDRGAENGGLFAWRVGSSNARLLLGTIRANRPWLLAASLSRSLSAALATGALTLITTDLWLLSAEYDGLQMALVGAVAVLSVTVSLVVGANLWERPRRRAEREQVAVFNIATVSSVLIGVVVLHVGLFAAALAGALLLVDPDVFAEVTGDPAHFPQYLKLAWFVGGLATIGSALGAGLEEDDDVRAAIFTRGSA